MTNLQLIKIDMTGETMDSENEINELLELNASYEVMRLHGEGLKVIEDSNELLDIYELGNDLYYIEVDDTERFINSIEYLKVELIGGIEHVR